MASIRVEVTAEDIAACPLAADFGGFISGHPDKKDPIEVAIARATGQDTMLDSEGVASDPAGHEVATMGKGTTTVVVDLPHETLVWLDAWYTGETVEPFAFDLVIEDWLVAMVARAATVDEQAQAVIATEPAG